MHANYTVIQYCVVWCTPNILHIKTCLIGICTDCLLFKCKMLYTYEVPEESGKTKERKSACIYCLNKKINVEK